MKLKSIIDWLNHFPMRIWIAIYLIVLGSHIYALYLGYKVSGNGYLVSIIPYYILLTKTKLWSKKTITYSLIMFIVFLTISVVIAFTSLIDFYEMCFLIGIYEFFLMVLLYKMPLHQNDMLDLKKISFVRDLLCVILLITVVFLIPFGLVGIIREESPVDISGVLFPFYAIAAICTLICVALVKVLNRMPSEDKLFKNSESLENDLNKVNQFFKDNDAFLKHDFSPAQLSEILGISKNRLSFLINKRMETNFYKLVAYHRINVAMTKMQNDSNYTLEHIAMQCGFTSMPVFIKYFKMFTGENPGQFRHSLTKIS